ncbi:ASCH/PUA domain-containing protein [Paraclostridium sordellii]|uniref:ASCH/PUA domain-containing protein n=1 Tax=Paraclostridium sordellii TaxID=1505 RepID=UPI0005E969D6|nr:ASCH/PUA domain-containing protein [Paeniclostridium sordellii]CEQ19681.1 gp91 [[Clostridium] sordellii] [Paeniclostridium sordellii]
MELHELKILPEYYEKVISGEKSFEVRKDDRQFSVGDLIRLKEFDKDFTGRDYLVKIIYKLNGGNYGLEKGYCILSIKPYIEGIDKEKTIRDFLKQAIKEQEKELCMYLSGQYTKGESYEKEIIDECIHDVRLLESYL